MQSRFEITTQSMRLDVPAAPALPSFVRAESHMRLDVAPAPAVPSMTSLRPWQTLSFDPVEHAELRVAVARQLRCAPDALGRFHELELLRGDAPKKKRRRTTGKNADPDALRALVVAYHSLVTRLIAPHIADHVPCDEILFQASPALRVHAPSAHAAGNRHRDSGYGHQASQVNFWLPLAPAFGTNTLHVENLRGDGRTAPLEGDFGVVHRFWGHELYHHTLPNDTPATRVRPLPNSEKTWRDTPPASCPRSNWNLMRAAASAPTSIDDVARSTSSRIDSWRT